VKELRFGVSVPVRIGDATPYVLTVVPRLGVIQAVVEQTFKPGDWTAAVIDGNGLVAARSSLAAEFFGRPIRPEFREQIASGNRLIAGIDAQGTPSITATDKSEVSRWAVAVWAPSSVIEQRANQAFWLILSMSAVAVACSALIGTFAARFVAEPTQRLVAAAQQLGQRKEIEVSPSSMREANIIANALLEAGDRVNFVMRELSHRTKNLLAVIQAIARQTSATAADKEDLSHRWTAVCTETG
jgi:hypothetical protein